MTFFIIFQKINIEFFNNSEKITIIQKIAISDLFDIKGTLTSNIKLTFNESWVTVDHKYGQNKFVEVTLKDLEIWVFKV